MASATGATDYAEIQENEIQAMQAIYGADCVEIEAKPGAWNKKSDREYTLSLRPRKYEDSKLCVILHIRYPITYPKTAPKCVPEFSADFPVKARRSVEFLIISISKEMLGHEMVYELAESIHGDLDIAAHNMITSEELPTLQEERAAQHAEAKQKEEALLAEQLEKQRLLEEEERESMQALVEQVKAKHKPRQSKVSFVDNISNSEDSFDMKVKMKNREGVMKEFNSITQKRRYRVGPVTTVYTAISAIPAFDSATTEDLDQNDEEMDCAPFLVMKECSIAVSASSGDLNKSIETLESDLRAVHKLQAHAGVCKPLAFRLEKTKAAWMVRILLPYFEKGSLYDLLETVGFLNVDFVRSWVLQLLDALEFLHRNKIPHGRVSVKNIMLERTESGETVVKLSDASFQHDLHLIQNQSTKFSSAASSYWNPSDKDNTRTIANDIWDLGIVALQMGLGLDVQERFSGPDQLIQGTNLSELFEDLVMLLFTPDAKKRPTAFTLKTNEFLRSSAPILDWDDSTEPSPSTPLTPKIPKARRDSHQAKELFSRYADEFLEVGVLGKGGFGQVVRARNKLDGSFYAIKKVKAKANKALDALLSEVSVLSKLNNPFIVRYYGAWIESNEGPQRPGPTSGESDSSDEDGRSLSLTHHSRSQLTASRTQESDFIGHSEFDDEEESDDEEEIDCGIQFGYDSDDENAIQDTDESTSDAITEATTDEPTEDADEESSDESEETSDGYDESDKAPAKTTNGIIKKKELVATVPVSLEKVKKQRRHSIPRGTSVTLYIQMEYCERQTLRDLIKDKLHTKDEECWRLFHQILEGLVYIHSHDVIHRDLKPENIFISQVDEVVTVRIGDFGLARPTEVTDTKDIKPQVKFISNGEYTASVGTSIYIAPEVKSTGKGNYNNKADMYSLGIILFEMSYPLTTGMERSSVLTALRKSEPELPANFNKPLNGSIILNLVKHKVSERPSSRELLRSGKIPSVVDDETIRVTLRSLGDKSSTTYPRFIEGLISQGLSDSFFDFAYDEETGLNFDTKHQTLVSWMQTKITAVFRRHGAIAVQRPSLMPYSPQYYPSGVFRLIDASGNVLQLPYDLTLPFARVLAKSDTSSITRKSFTFGTVFRELSTGLHPRMIAEADFDIVTEKALDLALREAEVIKVLDEIMDAVPSLVDANICYHLSHSKLIDAILVSCKVPNEQQREVKTILNKINLGFSSWGRIKSDLSNDLALPSTSIEALSRFLFQDSYKNAVEKLRAMIGKSEALEAVYRYLEGLITYLERFGVKREILINPFAINNEKFCNGNVLFSCVHRTTRKKKVFNEILAAGGRYDPLIQELGAGLKSTKKHAVGFNLAWKNIIDSMIAHQHQAEAGKSSVKKLEDNIALMLKNRRCDVLVDSVNERLLRSNGLQIIQELWANDISAELVIDSDIGESKSHRAQTRGDTATHDWLVLIKDEDNAKVRSMVTKVDSEVRISALIAWFKTALRERDRLEGAKKTASQKKEASDSIDQDADVTILVAESRSKKSNRKTVVEDAQARTSELSQSFLDCPIAAIELKDTLFEGIRETRISDPDSWRRFIQSAPLVDRQYLGQLHQLLLEKAEVSPEKKSKSCWIYNFRTKACLLYDLGKAGEK